MNRNRSPLFRIGIPLVATVAATALLSLIINLFINSFVPERSASPLSKAKGGGAGTFTDPRDGTVYKWVRIGEMVWMGENLNFGTKVRNETSQRDATPDRADKWCYNDDSRECEMHGGWYQWHTVMGLPAVCNSRRGGSRECPIARAGHHRGICPEGWHIPRDDEWKELADGIVNNNPWVNLKSYGFWSNRGVCSFWWSMKEPAESDGPPEAGISAAESAGVIHLYARNNGQTVELSRSAKKEHGFTLRCLRDERDFGEKPAESEPTGR